MASDKKRDDKDMNNENLHQKEGQEKEKINKDNESEKSDNSQEQKQSEQRNEKTNDAKESEQPSEENQEESWNNKYLRLMADFQNYKRRVENEKSDIYARANERIVAELLNVIDNFDRALENATDNADKQFTQGVEMIHKQLMTILDSEGVEEIKALGEDFDPNFHSAVMTAPSDEYKEGEVSEVLQKGYTLKGKVIRPATVKVAE